MTKRPTFKLLALAAISAFTLSSLSLAPEAMAKTKRQQQAETCKIKKKENQTDGVLVGGAVGALAGNAIAGKKHKTTGTVLGAVAGGLVGSEVGKNRPRCAKVGG
jgi:outer membrane lipoprotein SlyB